MAATKEPGTEGGWEPISDGEGRYSSGIADLDRLLGGGFVRGSFALVQVDETVRTEDERLLLTPTLLNFLYQSRGIIAVLPARDSPPAFRRALLSWVSRRRFDSRVRVVDYVGEAEDLPFVVSLQKKLKREEAMKRMAGAEKAAQGRRGRAFLELTAFEILETVVGAEMASRMYLYGIKRIRMVGNLGIGWLRPGLRIAEAVRAMADVELRLRRTALGLEISGIQPAFSPRLIMPDPALGPPHVTLVPPADGEGRTASAR